MRKMCIGQSSSLAFLEFVLQPAADAAKGRAEVIDALTPAVVARPLLKHSAVDRECAEVVDDLAVRPREPRAEVGPVELARGGAAQSDRNFAFVDIVAGEDRVGANYQPTDVAAYDRLPRTSERLERPDVLRAEVEFPAHRDQPSVSSRGKVSKASIPGSPRSTSSSGSIAT